MPEKSYKNLHNSISKWIGGKPKYAQTTLRFTPLTLCSLHRTQFQWYWNLLTVDLELLAPVILYSNIGLQQDCSRRWSTGSVKRADLRYTVFTKQKNFLCLGVTLKHRRLPANILLPRYVIESIWDTSTPFMIRSAHTHTLWNLEPILSTWHLRTNIKF